MRILIASTLLLVMFAGCTSDPDPADVPGQPDVPDAAGITTDPFEGNTGYSVQTPTRAFNNGGAFSYPLERDADLTGFVIEVVWAPNTANEEQLDLWVRDARAGTVPPGTAEEFQTDPIATATGASPLRLVVAADDFPDDADYEALVRAAGPVGVADNQDFTMYITTFTGVDLDTEYTALDQA